MAFIQRQKLDPHPAVLAIFTSFYSVGMRHHSCGLAAVTSRFLIATEACTLTVLSVSTVLSTSNLLIHSFCQQFLSVFCGLSADSSVVESTGPSSFPHWMRNLPLLRTDTRTPGPGQGAREAGGGKKRRSSFPQENQGLRWWSRG